MNRLTDNDREQGLSYAKVLTPQAPLVIVSNGEEAKFFQTHDGKEWHPSSKDDEAVKELFSHALSCAADERRDAVRLLLGKQPHLWFSLFRNYTESALTQLEGAVDDYTRPLAKGFTIDRSTVREITKRLISGAPLLVLTGPPLSGKTNVLAQVCRAEIGDLVPIYIDALSTSYGIFQHIADQFTRELYVQVQTSEIRQWLLHGIRSTQGRFVIIIDGWTANITGTLKEDMDELISFLQAGQSLSVLVSMDDTAFEEAKNIPGRSTHSTIGRNAEVIQLHLLQDEEFEAGCKILFDKSSACFHPGAQFNRDFRIPRLLRLVAGGLSRIEGDFPEDKGQIRFIPSVTSFLIFESWKQFLDSPELEGVFQDLAKAYVLDKVSRQDSPALALMSHGKGHIVQSTAESILGHEKLSKLKAQGYVGIVRGPQGKVLVLPKVPEFLAAAGAYVIADNCLLLHKEKGFESAYMMLVQESDHFPYGDLVGARALLEISNRDRHLAHDFVLKLLADEPKENLFTERSRALMYFEDVGEINVYFGKGTNERAIGNIHPCNILSQLSSYALLAVKDSLDPHLHILATIGSYPEILIRPYPGSVEEATKFHVHEIAGHGSVLCHQSGIIEPITHAMQSGFYRVPKSMISLCQFARENKLFFLAHRLNMAAMSTETCVEEKVAAASKEAQRILRPIIKDVIETAHKVGQDSEKKYGKVGRNTLCPCGSGKKYKKCCGR